MDIANVEGLNASPQTLDYSEVYSGLQLGTAEGQMNPLAIIQANKYYEVQKYLLLSYHECVQDVVIANPDFINKMSKSDQKKLQEVFDKVSKEAIANRAKNDAAAMEAIKKAKPDLKIVDMTDAQRAT